jgi:predicted ATPase
MKQNIIKLKSITISGFKSFDNNEHTIEFGDVSVLIGANGAGKSNLVSFFKMIGYMTTAALQQYIVSGRKLTFFSNSGQNNFLWRGVQMNFF